MSFFRLSINRSGRRIPYSCLMLTSGIAGMVVLAFPATESKKNSFNIPVHSLDGLVYRCRMSLKSHNTTHHPPPPCTHHPPPTDPRSTIHDPRRSKHSTHGIGSQFAVTKLTKFFFTEYRYGVLVLALIGKMSIVSTFVSVYVYTVELYPTLIR